MATDAVFTFDEITWDAAQRRGMCFPTDRVALALAADRRVERLLICNQPRSAPVKLVKDRLRPPAAFPASDRVHLYEPLRLRRRDPVSLSGLERSYARYGRRLRRAAERRGLRRPAVVTAHPFVAAFAELDWAGPVTLLASDDWAAHPAYERWRPAYLAAYERVARRRLRVCAVTQTIVERIEPQGPAAVVPNGVDPEEWLAVGPPPAWLTELPGPRFLYVGTLDSRLDVEAVLAVARAWPEGSVVLAGPVADPDHLAPLREEPNVHLPGPVPRDQVAALAHAADVCLVPHRQLPLTEAMSPLKIYEYMAGGGPVAATDLPPLRGIEGPLELVAPGGDFVAGVRAALARGPMAEAERQRFVADNAWPQRTDEVLALALGE
ncbi:MAG TPA: glycosyltransferase [Solirubrobacterales bacterium]|nr:glycosyltransferase [Solirubrobacterales bacterium]